MELDSRHVVRAAALLGGGFVIGCAILTGGIWMGLDRAAGRLERSVAEHGAAVNRAGAEVGSSINTASIAISQHAGIMAEAGKAVSRPEIKVVEPMPIQQPVEVRGPREDGALPVDAGIGK